MNVIYPQSVEPSDRPLLERATRLLEALVNTTSSGAPAINTTSSTGLATIGTPQDLTATWSKRTEDGHLIYVLTLSDPVAQVSAQFYPSDLQDKAYSPPLLNFRMARLWGDLLEKRSHRQLEKLLNLGRD